VLYDGKTYARIRPLPIDPDDEEHFYWSAIDPDLLYYANGQEVFRYSVADDESTSLRDFSTAPTHCTDDLSAGIDPMWTSWNGVLGLSCGDEIFAYNFETDTVSGIATQFSDGNAPQMSPSGAFAYLNISDETASVRSGATMAETRTLDLGADSHASMGMKQDGSEYFFSVQFDGPEGSLIASDLMTGVNTVVVGPDTDWPYPPTGTHVSAVAYMNPGWVALSATGDYNDEDDTLGQGVLENEIVLVDTNTNTICRVAHTHTCGKECGSVGYYAEAHATISPSGTRILFGSDWEGSPNVDTYVIELPAYVP
jgi:hypothetical protein